MSEQQLHDDMTNIVIQLKNVIPALQNLADTASENVDRKLDESLDKVDRKLKKLSLATASLEESTNSNSIFVQSAEKLALQRLKEGVKMLIDTDVSAEYQLQITEIIKRIEPLLTDKVSNEIARLADVKKISLEHYNSNIDDINKTIETDVKTIVKELSDVIEELNKVGLKIGQKADSELLKLSTVSTAHTDALKSVKSDTDTTALEMKKTLNAIKYNAILLGQSPTTMAILTVCFLTLSFLIALTYKYDLWIPVFVSMFVVMLLIGGVWGIIKGIEKMQENEK